MNDGQYISLRNYLEEIASQGKQLLAAQQRTNELLEQAAKATPATRVYNPTEGPIPYDPATSASVPEPQGRIMPPFTAETVDDKPKTATKKGK